MDAGRKPSAGLADGRGLRERLEQLDSGVESEQVPTVRAQSELDGKEVHARAAEHAPDAGDDAVALEHDPDHDDEDAVDELTAEATPPERGVWRGAVVAAAAAVCIAVLAGTAIWPDETATLRSQGMTLLGLQHPAKPARRKPVLAQASAAATVTLGLPQREFSATLGEAMPLPVDVQGGENIGKGSFVLVHGVPSRATLSQGVPFGAGAWRLEPAALTNLSITVYAMPAQRGRITIELLDREGAVLGRTNAAFAAEAPPRHAVVAQKEPAKTEQKSPATSSRSEGKANDGAPVASEPRTKSNRSSRRGARAASAEAKSAPAAAPKPKIAQSAPQQPKPKWTMNWNALSYSR